MLTTVATLNKRKPHRQAVESASPDCSCTIPKRLRTSAGLPIFLQPKLAISQPNDPAEVEAEQVAEQVMRMPAPTVQRQCAACEEEVEVSIARKPSIVLGEAVPASVSAVLDSPGYALDAGARSFFEPRFGRGLGHVRVHADAQASRSATDVQSLAYTVGTHIVFRDGQYAPDATEGRRLLGHELTHVVQQAGVGLRGSARLQRTVDPGSTNCVAGTDGATANPIGQLEWLEAMAASKAYLTASSLTTEVAVAHLGTRGPGGRTTQAYLARFGQSPARRGGFQNRLTGRVHNTQEEALDAEMSSLSARYERIANYMANHAIAYRCIGGTVRYGGCRTSCAVGEASACPGVNAIFLCAAFWGRDPGERTIMLIHEVAHILWANVDHVANFRHAECYASFVGDLFGGTGAGPACPTP
ncbi:MAG: DUF4157 domain-containing protein [Nitrospirota bacterium]|nr:DUF4157 domain-containing protein [Nitrospirota bacterium]MDP2383245.1 DUF4157 domain-containing protein [Nitrospirota bacterium]MDP3599382.1 DUF4157 domain-containing protein [Nitrospirota bacterium]